MKRSHETLDGVPLYCHVLAAICASIVTAIALALPVHHTSESQSVEAETQFRMRESPLPLPASSDTALANDDAQQSLLSDGWLTAIVKRGDSLSGIFARLGLAIEDLYSLIASSDEARELEVIRPGQSLRFRAGTDSRVSELVFETSAGRETHIIRDGDTFKSLAWDQNPEPEKRTAFTTGVINRSLYESARSAGLSDRIIMQLVEIFGWDIDFALDIHRGDSFTVLLEEDYLNGERLGNAIILAAEFINRGKTYRAVRYRAPDGRAHYYTPDGTGMRQAFLRSPVDFRRISSHFQPQRWHPVLGVRRPHRGVDYAAAAGTSIHASGDGKVIYVGRKGGYGKTVILQHRTRYQTLYAHMSSFRKGLRKGDRVTQGQIIGYVGKTGMATGPHLHYEFLVDGRHVNPVTVKLPVSPSVASRHQADFLRRTGPLNAQLDLLRRTIVAMNTDH